MGSGKLKAATGVATALICGAAAALVARDPRPADAPLQPPANNTPSPTASTSDPGLVIEPSCNNGRGAAPSNLTEAERDVVRQLQGATTASARRAILNTLPADERQQVTGYLASRNHNGHCTGGAANSELVEPSVVASSGSEPAITNTYVS